MIEVGMTYTMEKTVTPDMTAKAIGSGGLEVFGTPFMMGLMENAAMQLAAQGLDEGTTTVGGQISASHLKPTGLGHTVTATARLESVEGRKLRFHVTASDEDGLIGEGDHLRFVVDRERFMAKVSNK